MLRSGGVSGNIADEVSTGDGVGTGVVAGGFVKQAETGGIQCAVVGSKASGGGELRESLPGRRDIVATGEGQVGREDEFRRFGIFHGNGKRPRCALVAHGIVSPVGNRAFPHGERTARAGRRFPENLVRRRTVVGGCGFVPRNIGQAFAGVGRNGDVPGHIFQARHLVVGNGNGKCAGGYLVVFIGDGVGNEGGPFIKEVFVDWIDAG